MPTRVTQVTPEVAVESVNGTRVTQVAAEAAFAIPVPGRVTQLVPEVGISPIQNAWVTQLVVEVMSPYEAPVPIPGGQGYPHHHAVPGGALVVASANGARYRVTVSNSGDATATPL